MMRAGRRSRRGMAAATAAASVAAVPRLACQRRLLSASAVARGEVGVAVVGGSGYTGAELIRLLAAHPYAKVSVRMCIAGARARTCVRTSAPAAPASWRVAPLLGLHLVGMCAGCGCVMGRCAW
jgi:hypothetical protein